MNVAELIEKLQKIEDESKTVAFGGADGCYHEVFSVTEEDFGHGPAVFLDWE